jgi:Arsenate reductase and related proteins, glutaredoxin family
MVAVTLYHNPRCSTSRKALDLLRENGVEPVVVEYLKVGWTADTLRRLARETGVGLKGLLRQREEDARALATASDTEILKAALANPVLIERPIVEGPKGARIGRPVEQVLEVL